MTPVCNNSLVPYSHPSYRSWLVSAQNLNIRSTTAARPTTIIFAISRIETRKYLSRANFNLYFLQAIWSSLLSHHPKPVYIHHPRLPHSSYKYSNLWPNDDRWPFCRAVKGGPTVKCISSSRPVTISECTRPGPLRWCADELYIWQ